MAGAVKFAKGIYEHVRTMQRTEAGAKFCAELLAMLSVSKIFLNYMFYPVWPGMKASMKYHFDQDNLPGPYPAQTDYSQSTRPTPSFTHALTNMHIDNTPAGSIQPYIEWVAGGGVLDAGGLRVAVADNDGQMHVRTISPGNYTVGCGDPSVTLHRLASVKGRPSAPNAATSKEALEAGAAVRYYFCGYAGAKAVRSLHRFNEEVLKQGVDFQLF
jgi:hypothetical protein